MITSCSKLLIEHNTHIAPTGSTIDQYFWGGYTEHSTCGGLAPTPFRDRSFKLCFFTGYTCII